MQRILLSSQKVCTFKCAYCFTRRNDYRYRSLFPVGKAKHTADILYPLCDVEMNLKENVELLNELCKEGKIISISTKSIISAQELEELVLINNFLRKRGAFLKIGIPITSKSKLSEIERGAAEYQERMNNLQKLRMAGIPSSLVIKPVLPFVPISEYEEIIDAAIGYTQHFLLGGLYVDKKSVFYQQYLTPYETVRRKVSWLEERPKWDYIEFEETMSSLKSHILIRGGMWFENDADLLKNILKESTKPLLVEGIR